MERPLNIHFLESGVGETIIITFPDGGIGIVDAHPSTIRSRPDILDLVGEKHIHFICLTHPHADHGLDLIPILKNHPNIRWLWHTVPELDAFLFAVQQTTNFQSPLKEWVHKFHKNWGRFLIEIFGNAAKRGIPHKTLRADLEAVDIEGVKVHFLSPDLSVTNNFRAAHHAMAQEAVKNHPDPNLLSAIIALEYGDKVIILGADALKGNWESAVKKFSRLKLSKGSILKVPHHGASNALALRNDEVSYLDICAPGAFAVLFAGDSKHPDVKVHERLRVRTNLMCTSNGLRGPLTSTDNPLNLRIPGARAVGKAVIPCQSVISFAIGIDGVVERLAGYSCSDCHNTECLQK